MRKANGHRTRVQLRDASPALRRALANKAYADDRFYKYTITVMDDLEGGWIEEAPGEGGVPYRCFGDTSDKIVITPFHLDYQDFTYPMSRGGWGICSYNADALEAMNRKIFSLGREFNARHGFEVAFLFPGIDMKGHNDSEVVYPDFYDTPAYDECVKRHPSFEYDAAVLFVFGLALTPEFREAWKLR